MVEYASDNDQTGGDAQHTEPTRPVSPQLPKGQDNALSLLNDAIEAISISRESSTTIPAKAVFGSAIAALAMIRVHFLLPNRLSPAHI